MSDQAAREELAARIDRYAWPARLAILPLVAVGVIDLAANSPTGDHRLDYVCLSTGVGSAYFAYQLRRLTRRLRAGTLPERGTRGAWAQAALSVGVSSAFNAVVGYLIGGWIVAAALASATAGLCGAVTAAGIRRRRRARALRPS